MTSRIMATRMGTTCGPTSLIAIAMGATACNEDSNSVVHAIFQVSIFEFTRDDGKFPLLAEEWISSMHMPFNTNIHVCTCAHAHTTHQCEPHSGSPN